MPYEYNPLIKDCFQKKSEVTPSDIQQLQNKISELQDSSENLKLKKVTKFFSANDYLEENEIAQFQGEDDAAHNLTTGFFYKKNPAFSIVSNEDSFAYSTAELLNVYDFDNNLALQQYYLDDINLSSDDYGIIGNNNYFTLVFNPNLFVNNTLPNSLLPGFVFYPYLNVGGIWDFANPVTILNGNYIYKGNIIQMSPLRFGLMGAVLAASMTSPYYRYLWIYILMETYVGVIAVNFCTNSSNILTALGVVNSLSCFGFLYRTTITPTPRVNFNATGYVLSENQPFQYIDPHSSFFKVFESGDFVDIIFDNYIIRGVNYIAIFGDVTNKPFGGCYVQIFACPPKTGFLRLVCYESGGGGVKNAIININTREITYFN